MSLSSPNGRSKHALLWRILSLLFFENLKEKNFFRKKFQNFFSPKYPKNPKKRVFELGLPQKKFEIFFDFFFEKVRRFSKKIKKKIKIFTSKMSFFLRSSKLPKNTYLSHGGRACDIWAPTDFWRLKKVILKNGEKHTFLK